MLRIYDIRGSGLTLELKTEDLVADVAGVVATGLSIDAAVASMPIGKYLVVTPAHPAAGEALELVEQPGAGQVPADSAWQPIDYPLDLRESSD